MKTCGWFLFVVMAVSGVVWSARAMAGTPDGWHGVDPGFSVQVLVGRGDAMWAAGSGESIAESTDAGQHWVVRHRDTNGALLLTLRFVDAKFGYAAGSGGAVLFTEDGGETWTANQFFEETILQAAFGDEQHGVVRTISGLLSTQDGGMSWNPVVPASDSDWKQKYPVTVGMVAVDENRMTVRVSQTLASAWAGEFLWTEDGGATWNASGIDGTRIYDLYTARGGIWAAGYEGSTPMSFRQGKGADWDHVPVNYEACHWPGCGGYTAQGYFAGKDFLLLTSDGKETMAKFPVRDVLTSQWARSGNRLCMVSNRSIECAELQTAGKVEMNREMPGWEQAGFSGIGRIPRSNPQCLRCDLQPRYFAKTDAAGMVEVEISFVVEPSGSVANAEVIGKVPDEVVASIRKQTANWFFEPPHKGGVVAAAKVSLRARVMIADPSTNRGIVVKVAPAAKAVSPKPPQ